MEEPLVEVHILNLDREDHADACLPDVLREHLGHELNQGKHPYVHQDSIEDEGVDESLVGKHRVECEAEKPHAYSHIALNSSNHHVVADECEENGCKHAHLRVL